MGKKEDEIYKVFVNGTHEVRLKHDFLGWRVVHPWKNTDGSINWKNLISGGSWMKLLITIGFVIIILGAMLEYASQLSLLTKCLAALNDTVILIP